MAGFDFSALREVLDVITSVILPIAGGVVTYSEVREARIEKRTRNFRMANEVSPEDRGTYAEHSLDLYREYYADRIRRGEVTVRHLVYRPEWVQKPGNDAFMTLNEMPVTVSQTYWETPPPKAKFLPYPRDGFAVNKKYQLGGKTLLFNGKLYALEDFTGDINKGNLAVTVKNGGYFDLLDTCEYLVYEMSYARKILRKRPPYHIQKPAALSVLPGRSRQADVFDLSNRFAGIGVNNATILYNVEMPEDARDSDSPMVKKHILLLHHRSGQVAEGIGSVHVVPAGSYQPVGVDIRSDFNVQMANTVYREFGEELLNIDEFFHLSDEEVLEEQYRRWKVILLGMGFEPLNTKVEVLTAMKIDMDDKENRKFFGGAYTLDGLTKFFSDNYEGKLSLVPLDKKTLHQYEADPRTTQSGKEILAIMQEHMDFFKNP